MGPEKTEWFVYIIKTKNGRLYTGITTDLKRRFQEHKNSSHGAKYFRFSHPAKLVYTEAHPNRSAATRRELAIKRLSRAQKDQLIKVWKG